LPAGQVSLEGLTIGEDGFLLLCSTETSNTAYDDKCDVIVGPKTAVDNEGDESVAIVLEKPNGDLETVDIFGRPDRDGSGTDQDFTHGRAARNASAKDPSDVWNPKDWDVMPGQGSTTVDISGMDPREWFGSSPTRSPEIDINPVDKVPSTIIGYSILGVSVSASFLFALVFIRRYTRNHQNIHEEDVAFAIPQLPSDDEADFSLEGVGPIIHEEREDGG